MPEEKEILATQQDIAETTEPSEETPAPAKSKRGRKPNPEKRTGYFYEEEEEAFKTYVTSTDQNVRNRIFREKLYPAFTKMIESIIRRYRLFTPSEDYEDTFHDTMSFLMTKVNNFDVTKGYKAYSYCGTVCKRYLLLKRTQDMKHTENTLSYDKMFGGAKDDNREYEPTETNPFYNEVIDETVNEIKDMLINADKYNIRENEEKVGYALIEMLTNWDEIFARIESRKFNRTSVTYFISEYTMLSPKEVREAMRKYRDIYNFTKERLIEG